ncbi:hypothetical protein [uncultured Brachyspira sp.]|uniref:hypothetical protein n=1 Tax=uncultured Brachyspira sp. TaxID=221953 RepID=UPI0025FB866A|nr:hypothetical protein [uncultured Brachyspira sp.]
MEVKEISLSKSYLYGFFAAMISTLIYSAIAIPVYILLISSNPNNFLVYLLYTLDIWVWIWISMSILYAFVVVFIFSAKEHEVNLRKSIGNILFFVVTSIVMLLSLSYIPEIQKILYRQEYTFYSTILSLCLFFMAIFLSYNIRNIILFMYNLILFNLGYEDSNSSNSSINEAEKTNTLEYEIFNNTLKTVISFSQRHNYAIGIMAFNISNANDIIEQYDRFGYYKIRKDLVAFIKREARAGESQCLIDDDIIYIIVYANEEEALKITKRYLKMLQNYNFSYNGDNIDVKVSMAVSGFDFADNKANKISIFTVKDNLTDKIKEALRESKETESPVIVYQKGI